MRFTNGWIKVHRKLLGQEWSQCLDAVGKGVLLELLLMANIQPTRCIQNSKVRILGRGQLVIGIRKLAESLVIDRSTLVRRLEILKNMGTITLETSHEGTIITICKFEEYQENKNESEPSSNQQTNHQAYHQATTEPTTEPTPIEELKNLKNSKKKKNTKNLILAEGSKDLPAEKIPSHGSQVWNAYATAYELRYGHKPARNARDNSLCSQIVQRVGVDEAIKIAEFYLSHSDRWYVQKVHPLNLLLADVQKLRTEWLAGDKMTSKTAKTIEIIQSNKTIFEKYRERMEKDEGKIS